MTINLVLALFAGAVLLLSAFSTALQRVGLPGPLLALTFGVLIGPYALNRLRIEDFGVPAGTLLEEAARITLAVGLTGVALRLPHGYWRANLRWVAAIIGLGMPLMLLVGTGILWGALGIPLLSALLVAAIITPTDPVVTTPIVTGSMAKENIPERIRNNLSAESGINDGLGYLFVMLPVLLLTRPQTAWGDLLTTVLLWEVVGAAAFGVMAGYAFGRLFVFSQRRGLMEESSYLGFIVPLGLFVLGMARLWHTDALLAVFLAAAVFGQVIPQRDEEMEAKVDDAVNQFFLLPVFILLGMALPLQEWGRLGWAAAIVLLAAVLVRRLVAVWVLRPLLRPMHDKSQTFIFSWFGPIGISALFYATLAERHTGRHDVFAYTTLAITCSVLVHGLSTAPLGAWLARHESRVAQHRAPA